MDFRIEAQLPATAAQLWTIFFDVHRVASLIPGCEAVQEVESLKEYSAVMKQRIGVFKLEVPTHISVERSTFEREIALHATGRDKFTATLIDMHLTVVLEERTDAVPRVCDIALDARLQVAGRLASLGYPVVKKRSEELFAEFERRLRGELASVDQAQAPQSAVRAGQPSRHGEQEASVPVVTKPPQGRLTILWPWAGAGIALGLVVALAASVLGGSAWWWLALPALAVAAGVRPRNS